MKYIQSIVDPIVIPTWILPAIIIFIIILIGSLMFIIILRHQVKIRTIELAILNEDLEGRIFERSEQLINVSQRLHESERMSIIGKLTAGIVHEINSPLGVSVTAASLITDYADKNPDAKNDLKNISDLLSRNLQRVVNLVKRFKELSISDVKDGAGIINLSDFFSYMKQYINTLFDNNRWEISWIYPEGSIHSNQNILISVFIQLFMNIKDHAYPKDTNGKIEVNVQYPAINNNELLTIKIKDYGMGMNEEIKKQAFDPFYSTKRDSGNLGLGLNITYNNIVDNLHGKLLINSKRNKGTEIVIEIPVKSAIIE